MWGRLGSCTVELLEDALYGAGAAAAAHADVELVCVGRHVVVCGVCVRCLGIGVLLGCGAM